ncbi:MAG: outer membrane lipoprotein-sorting protein [Candidatus Parabeggiatoa sp. nov. 2]|nr:MAG: outer membrane lipoprotein-sorting protein [Beggiatoa sp. 4572_84]
MFNKFPLTPKSPLNPLFQRWERISAQVFILLLMSFACTSQAANVQTILNKADSYRLPEETVQVKTRVDLYKSGQLDKTRHYNVYIKPGRRSLVIFKSAVERGQKVLMLNDKFWIVMPKSRRPIRITPMQKLLGEASTGDIATMTWSEDYDGYVSGKEMINNIPCLKLALHTIRRGTTYARIELYVAQDGYWPVKANFYMASGKLAKRAYFTLTEVEGRKQVKAMTLYDKIQRQRQTVIRYLSLTPRSIPDKFYNPMYLVRNRLQGW